MSVKISVVIPTYTLNKELENFAIRAILSYKEQADEIVVTEDSGMFSHDIFQLADIYIYGKENVGFTANVNRGWRNANGEYTMIVNSDTYLMKGNLSDLCIPNMVTSPEIKNQYIDRLAGPFFVIPRTVKEERGMLIEAMKTYSSDSEYDERVKDIFQKVPSVQIYHEQAQTVKAAGVEGGEEQQRDREIYAELIKRGKVK